MNKRIIIILVITLGATLGLFLGLICYGIYNKNRLNNKAKSWDQIKPIIDGVLKRNLMQINTISEDEYMQGIVGIWAIANVEPEHFLNFFGSSGDTKHIISQINKIQKEIRICFGIKEKFIKKKWGESCLSSIFRLLLHNISEKTPNEIQKNIVNEFYEKHKTGEDVFKRKVKGGKGELTFVENAFLNIPSIYPLIIYSRDKYYFIGGRGVSFIYVTVNLLASAFW